MKQFACPKKELEVGRCYITESQRKFYYFGRVQIIVDGVVEEGILRRCFFNHYNCDTFNKDPMNYLFDKKLQFDITKSVPKFVETTDFKIEVPRVFEFDWETMAWNNYKYKHSVKITFLDVSED